MRLKNIIQDMINRGDLTVDGLKTNDDHDAFKIPLPNYNKGGPSSSNDTEGARINHLYNNTINHILTDDNQINFIKIKDKQDHASINVTTRAQKYVLKGQTSTSTTIPKTQYNVVDQVRRTLAQISILNQILAKT